MPIRYFLSGSQTNVMPITCCHQSQTSAVCLMFQRGRNSVLIYDTYSNSSGSHEALAGLSHSIISGTHLTQCHVQLYGRHKAWKLQVIRHTWRRGKADAALQNCSIVAYGGRRSRAQSLSQSSLSGGRGVRHGTTQSVIGSQQNKSQNWSKYQG